MGKNKQRKWDHREIDSRMAPFEKAYIPQSEIDLLVKAFLDKGYDKDEIDRAMKEESLADIYTNNLYQVSLNRKDSSVPEGWVHLSIKRRDRKPIHDWRHLQMIKNELVGPEYEAAELYPAESRLMDTANQYHLYVCPKGERFPFGYDSPRFVTEDTIGKSRQRKF